MAQLHLKVVTPEKQILDESVDQVNISTEEGMLGILPNHASLMAKVKPGELTIKSGSKHTLMAVGGGFMQVSDGVMTVMTDLAQRAEDINEKEVEDAKRRAEKALSEKLSDEEQAATVAALERSIAQLNIKRRHKVR